MLKLLKKPLTFLLTGSFSVVFAACYGAPMNLENPKLVKAKNESNDAITGLKVSLFENRLLLDEQFTNENGAVEFYFTQRDKYNYTALIEDVDGEENLGNFRSEEVNLTDDSFIEIKLEKVD